MKGRWPGQSALLFLASLFLAHSATAGPRYDLLLKGGHVIDPSNGINAIRDVAVSAGRIAWVAEGIPPESAEVTVDVSGLVVTPGLIDIHTHHFNYIGSIFPDDSALPNGTTTTVDCGGPGWRNFEEFKRKIVDRSKTRVLAFINIVGHGMRGRVDYEDNVEDMDPEATASKIREYPEIIVGIKNAHFGLPGWTSIERSVEAGRLSGKPVILDNPIFSWQQRDTRTKLLELLRPGDMHTHMYNDRHLQLLDRETRKVASYMWKARKRGVRFDVGHGNGSFLWTVAAPAMEQGFPPDTISSDLHANSILNTESDMPNCMSKFMLMGMSLQEAVKKATVVPAQVIQRFPELGTLSPGRVADIAVIEMNRGVFALHDAWKKKRLGTVRLRNVLTVREGEIVYDLKGLSFSEWDQPDAYETSQ